jgi:hypothetical protein
MQVIAFVRNTDNTSCLWLQDRESGKSRQIPDSQPGIDDHRREQFEIL